MSEIEKMYVRCKIQKQQTCSHSDTCYNGSLDECEGCKAYQYPPFTAEKQLNIIKWLMKNRKDYQYDIYNDTYWFIIDNDRECKKYRKFDEALAELINLFWQDLTEEEKQQVKGILE